jgi:hypothetical protein
MENLMQWQLNVLANCRRPNWVKHFIGDMTPEKASCINLNGIMVYGQDGHPVDVLVNPETGNVIPLVPDGFKVNPVIEAKRNDIDRRQLSNFQIYQQSGATSSKMMLRQTGKPSKIADEIMRMAKQRRDEKMRRQQLGDIKPEDFKPAANPLAAFVHANLHGEK